MVVGFDDIALVGCLVAALTTVRIHKEAVGAIAVKCLLTRAVGPTMASVSCVLEVIVD